jgi:VIT family.
MNKESFENHIKNEHQSSPLATYLEECVYGGNDGIVTTFAVVAGFSGANIGQHTINLSIVAVLLFGVAN